MKYFVFLNIPIAYFFTNLMSAERDTKQAHEHIRAIVRLANTLISESINKNDPIQQPVRSISTSDFLTQYKEHYQALLAIMSKIDEPEEHEVEPDIDEKIRVEREELNNLVTKLQNKLEKLDHLRFWMDNMVFDKTAPAVSE